MSESETIRLYDRYIAKKTKGRLTLNGDVMSKVLIRKKQKIRQNGKAFEMYSQERSRFFKTIQSLNDKRVERNTI